MSTSANIEVILDPRIDPPEYIIEIRDYSHHGSNIIHTETHKITHPGGKLINKIEQALVENAIPILEDLYDKYSKKYNMTTTSVACTSKSFSDKAHSLLKSKYHIHYYYDLYALRDRKGSKESESPAKEKKNTAEIILLSL